MFKPRDLDYTEVRTY